MLCEAREILPTTIGYVKVDADIAMQLVCPSQVQGCFGGQMMRG